MSWSRSNVTIKCCICTVDMAHSDTAPGYWAKSVCSQPCHQEREWRQTLAICGKQYYPDPKKATE